MRYYLIGFDRDDDPVVIFYDVQHFENDVIGDFDAISFREDGIDYTYTGQQGKNYEEIDGKAPSFYSYKYLDEKQAEPYIKHFGGYVTNAQAQAAKTNKKKTKKSSSSNKNVNINITQGTAKITLSTGKEVDLLDPNAMSGLTPDEVKEVEKIVRQHLGIFMNSNDVPIEVNFTKDKNNPTITSTTAATTTIAT